MKNKVLFIDPALYLILFAVLSLCQFILHGVSTYPLIQLNLQHFQHVARIIYGIPYELYYESHGRLVVLNKWTVNGYFLEIERFVSLNKPSAIGADSDISSITILTLHFTARRNCHECSMQHVTMKDIQQTWLDTILTVLLCLSNRTQSK